MNLFYVCRKLDSNDAVTLACLVRRHVELHSLRASLYNKAYHLRRFRSCQVNSVMAQSLATRGSSRVSTAAALDTHRPEHARASSRSCLEIKARSSACLGEIKRAGRGVCRFHTLPPLLLIFCTSSDVSFSCADRATPSTLMTTSPLLIPAQESDR